MEVWRLFVLARERKCEPFTSQQRTSSPGKLKGDRSNILSAGQEVEAGGIACYF